MDEDALRTLLDAVRTGSVAPDDAVAALRRLPYADLGFARVDHHRALRQGLAEAVYGPGKTPAQCAAIVAELLDAPGERPVLLTRASPAQVAAALARNPGGTVTGGVAAAAAGAAAVAGVGGTADAAGPEAADDAVVAGASPTAVERAGGAIVAWRAAGARPERVVLATAGTADLPVAEECAAVLAAHGIAPVRLTDVGVAGVHRLLASADVLASADAVVVVAGMEGALASIVGGITPAPVVAVPTSAGYGASLEGITALLGMLASCAAGLTVVGIDNGFGAACAVLRMLGTMTPATPSPGREAAAPAGAAAASGSGATPAPTQAGHPDAPANDATAGERAHA
jgi:NCAIR mutase (PurE)-related protein